MACFMFDQEIKYKRLDCLECDAISPLLLLARRCLPSVQRTGCSRALMICRSCESFVRLEPQDKTYDQRKETYVRLSHRESEGCTACPTSCHMLHHLSAWIGDAFAISNRCHGKADIGVARPNGTIHGVSAFEHAGSGLTRCFRCCCPRIWYDSPRSSFRSRQSITT